VVVSLSIWPLVVVVVVDLMRAVVAVVAMSGRDPHFYPLAL
jgi:hypothetical protein